jgi:predicted HAD superfamily Cof-like phosphohydrolase
LKKILKDVKEFQQAFNSPTSNKPTLLPLQRAELRFDLMREENAEYFQAALSGDLVEVADALGDMLYVLAGTIIEHGMLHIIEDLFAEIHESNMSKLDFDGKPIINGQNGVYDPTKAMGKVLKSTRYFKPDIKKILESSTQKLIDQEKTLRGLLDDTEAKRRENNNSPLKREMYHQAGQSIQEQINYITK